MNKSGMLKVSLNELDALIKNNINCDDETFIKWRSKTEMIIRDVFGELSAEYRKILDYEFISSITYANFSKDDIQKEFIGSMKDYRNILVSYIEFFELKESK